MKRKSPSGSSRLSSSNVKTSSSAAVFLGLDILMLGFIDDVVRGTRCVVPVEADVIGRVIVAPRRLLAIDAAVAGRGGTL